MVFLKWIGSKQQHTKTLSKYLPEQFNNYFEPFLGSGSFYFFLKTNGYLNGKQATLSDTNYDLIAAFICLQDRVRLARTMQLLEQHKLKHTRKYFKQVKDATYGTLEELAARFIYFNRAVYSGIYRETRFGEFNVSMKGGKIGFLDRSVYTIAGQRLQGATIKSIDYSVLEGYVKPGDFLYFDPPYTKFFLDGHRTVYGMFDFDLRSQKALREFCDYLSSIGAYWMQSNSSDDFTWDLYEDMRIETFEAVYTPNGASRVREQELIIMNYDSTGQILQ